MRIVQLCIQKAIFLVVYDGDNLENVQSMDLQNELLKTKKDREVKDKKLPKDAINQHAQ